MARAIVKKIIVSLLTLEAKLVLRKYRPKIIAITGNVGKTSTKDAIFTVLSTSYHVRKSEKSFNSDIGVPLTILGCSNAWSSPTGWASNLFEGFLLIVMKAHYPKWLVLEVGADRPGDISGIAKWLQPDIAVLTRLPELPVHVEYFESAEAVRAEKLSLLDHMKADGVVVGNGDDPYIREALQALPKDARHSTYGLQKEADVTANKMTITYEKHLPTGIRAEVHHNSHSLMLSITGGLGRQHLYAALGGIAAGHAAGISIEKALRALAVHALPPGRMRIIEGKSGSTIIDDTYNSSPAALEEALATLKSVRGDRKIAVLGDMLELGEFSIEAHRRAGEQAATSADILISVGVRAAGLLESARTEGMPAVMTHPVENAEAATTLLAPLVQEGDVILVKGSQSTRLERVVAALMAHPEQRNSALVRQDAEWLARS